MTATYPAYSPTEQFVWYLGAHATNATGGVQDGAAAGAAGWFVRTMRLRLNPGTYTLKTIHCGVLYMSASKVDAVRFGIFAGDGTAASLVTLGNGANYIDVTANVEDTASSRNFAGALGDVTVTIEAGTNYWFGLLMHKSEATALYPSVRQMNDGQWVLGDIWKGQVNSDLAAMPTDSTGLTYVAAGDAAGEQSRMALEFSTSSRIIYSIDATAYAGSATEMIIPRIKSTTAGDDYWIFLKSSVVADGQALTVALEADNNADEAVRTTLVQDLGATDQMTFGSANVALAAAGAEAGDTFDLGINVRANGKMDLFYMNRTSGQGGQGDTDIVTISHACKNGAARNAEYTITRPDSLKISGTAAVAKIQVAWQPLLILGDSQSIDNPARIGGNLPTSFTHPRAYWNAGISGRYVSTTAAGQSISGWQAWHNDTPGGGDLCEMTNMLFVWPGFGINDISLLVGTSEPAKRTAVAEILQYAAQMLDDAVDKGHQILVIGLPPYSDPVNASTHEAKAVQLQLNPGLEGLAIAVQGAYVNPWYALVSGSQEDAIPTANPTYIDAGLHYLAPGAALVCQMAARAHETALIGGWWLAPWRRLSRSKGSLFPI